jgi:hypothetical protein
LGGLVTAPPEPAAHAARIIDPATSKNGKRLGFMIFSCL